jgi:cytochrome c5
VKIVCAVLFASLSLGAFANEKVAVEEAERIYRESCAACHRDGVSGAPRPGVKTDWVDRMSYGIDGLYFSAIEGLIPQMPQRGSCFECSDAQLAAVVDFMVRNLE